MAEARYEELRGKTAVVTGGSRGIGVGIVRMLVADGANVVFNYRRSADQANELVAELGADRAKAVKADLCQPSELATLWEEASEWNGGVDLLVHNAAIREPIDYLRCSDEDFDKAWVDTTRAGLIGPAQLSRYAIRDWLDRDSGGVIVGITGRHGMRGDFPETFQDGSSKGGLNALMKGISRAYAANGIVAYLLSVGVVESDQLTEQLERDPDPGRYLREVPMNRFGTPEDVAEVVTFLCSGRAQYATGSTIQVGGASFVF